MREVCSIPETYRDLSEGRTYAALSTIMPDGQPQSTVVWCDFDGGYVLINTIRGFRKEKNMRANPRVTLLAYEQCNPLRSLEVRGTVVEMTETGALEHLDRLSVKYTGRGPYFGACVPAELKEREVPVLCRIAPTRVVTLNAGSAADNVNFFKPPRPVPAGGFVPESHLDLVARPLQAAASAPGPVEAVLRLRSSLRSTRTPAPEATRDLAQQLVARVAKELGAAAGEYDLTVFPNLGYCVVSAPPGFVERRARAAGGGLGECQQAARVKTSSKAYARRS